MVPNSSRFSGTSARPAITRSSSVSRATSAPPKRTWPRVIGSTPINAASSVDLPAPLGPITVITLPCGAARPMPRSTSAAP